MGQTTAPSALTITNVTKSYGDVRAVDGLDLTIRAGETVALLGPNGAGKSTTIAMALGLTEPDTGTVRVFGGEPERAVRGGRIGAMPQENRLIPRVRVRELSWRVAFDGSFSVAAAAGLSAWFAAFAAVAVYAYRRSTRAA